MWVCVRWRRDSKREASESVEYGTILNAVKTSEIILIKNYKWNGYDKKWWLAHIMYMNDCIVYIGHV